MLRRELRPRYGAKTYPLCHRKALRKLVTNVCALVLGVIGGLSINRSLGPSWLATVPGATALDASAANAIGAFFRMGRA